MKIDSSLGNYYIQCKKERFLVSDEQGTYTDYKYKLYLYNQLNDSSEYNLDTSNVKNIPLQLIYIFDISLLGQNQEIVLETRLINLIGTKNFKDPYSFDIRNHMGILN